MDVDYDLEVEKNDRKKIAGVVEDQRHCTPTHLMGYWEIKPLTMTRAFYKSWIV